MLHLINISKSFGGTRVLQNVSLEIPAGNITALIGPNGAGKTTLFDVVTGAVRQDEGTILFRPPLRHCEERSDEAISGYAQNNEIAAQSLAMTTELNISKPETYERARLGISRTFQQVKLCENLTILDHFEMVKNNEDENLLSNVIPGLDPESKNKNKKQKDSATNHYSLTTIHYKKFLHSLSLEKPLETRVIDLSYGQRKLLDLGLALFRSHSILLLDEPVAGVNQVVRKTIHSLLQNLKAKKETVLLVEHDIEFVRSIADIVIVLDEGRVLTQGSPSEVFSNRQVMEAYLGE